MKVACQERGMDRYLHLREIFHRCECFEVEAPAPSKSLMKEKTRSWALLKGEKLLKGVLDEVEYWSWLVMESLHRKSERP